MPKEIHQLRNEPPEKTPESKILENLLFELAKGIKADDEIQTPKEEAPKANQDELPNLPQDSN